MSKPAKRWMDKDPAIRQALESLRGASDKYQVQIALNIIMVILEHHVESETLASVDDLVEVLEQSKQIDKAELRRWYDVNETLRSALKLLEECPEDVQARVIPGIQQMVEDSLNKLK